jgi:hypothetical protein
MSTILLDSRLGRVANRRPPRPAAVEAFLIEALGRARPQTDQRRGGLVLAAGRADGSIRGDVNATDVIMCSALTTQSRCSTGRTGTSRRCHIALFSAGLKAVDDDALPGQLVKQSDVEAAFAKARPKP